MGKLALTLGDPAGIGPEIVLKAIADLDRNGDARDRFVLVGPRSLWYQAYESLRDRTDAPLANPATWAIADVPVATEILTSITWGQASAASGAASFASLQGAIDLAVAGEVAGIVTAPIAKSAWAAAGHAYPGQTEVLAQRAGVERFGMAFIGRSPHTGWTLRTLLATTHIPLAAVPTAVTPELLDRKLALLIDHLQNHCGIAQPRIAIAGLNPHSGEQGHLGTEERDRLLPWLASARDRNPHAQLTGLVPPDTLWVAAAAGWYGEAIGMSPCLERLPDAYLALYHDQGLIPVKLLAFDRAVNTTLGLPFIRTSPDHGTAFDIAGQGIARAISFRCAIDLAWENTRDALNLKK
jgi:4-hydroxythreonine-4-phosphate dehydrogenase